jgi:precorrin-2/cobalt-factor-2 C20-methyltransferase
MSVGRLTGVGVGPGDPELLTLRAVRALREADLVAHFAKAGSPSNARAVAAAHIKPGVVEMPLLYPVTTEMARAEPAYQATIRAFYDASAAMLAKHLDAGRAVAVLSEGDPLFYGSYMHLHARLSPRYPTTVVPGITSLSGCWSAAGVAIAQGDDVLTVLPGTLPEEALARRLGEADAAVVIKLGRNLPKVRRALAAAGRLNEAIYVERGTMANGVTIALAEKADDQAPYFAVVLVPGWAGRP